MLDFMWLVNGNWLNKVVFVILWVFDNVDKLFISVFGLYEI